MNERIDDLLMAQYARYPRLEVQDLVKALYQATFGCGHLALHTQEGLNWLLAEQKSCAERGAEDVPLTEPLGAFARVHISALRQSGLAASTLYALFVLSAQEKQGEMETFLTALSRLEALIEAGTIPLDKHEARQFLIEYRAAGCPMMHHSRAFHAAYAPAYRVISAAYARLLPILCALECLMEKKQRVLCAIEGGSASGKTTLAALMKKVYGARVFHMDDYFLQPHQRTAERLEQPGGNVDYERFYQEIIVGLQRGEAFKYRPYDCHTGALCAPKTAKACALNIIEGAYSMHPALEDAYDLSIFLDIDAKTQAQRILSRNGAQMQRRFLDEWIPLEENYFAQTGARARCDMHWQTEEYPLL